MSAYSTRTRKSEPRIRCGSGRRGAAVIEATLTLMLFLTFWFSLFDFGFALFFHHTLVHQVRAAARWAIVNAYDATTTPDQITNMVLYNQPTAPSGATSGVLGLTAANVAVNYAVGRVNQLTVTVSNYQFPLITLGFAGLHIGQPITVSLPMEWQP